MKYVIGWLKLRRGRRDEFMALARPFVAKSLAEEGVVFFEFHHNTFDPDSVVVVERYSDHAAHERHWTTPHFKSMWEQVQRLVLEGRFENIFAERREPDHVRFADQDEEPRGIDRHAAERTRAIYEAAAEGFDRRRSRALFERGWLDRLLALVPPGMPVLDLGCGAGEPVARYLIDAGRPVTGVDFAGAMLAAARARFPEQAWIEADMRGLELGRRFGGIVAWDSFFHLTPEEQRAMFPVFSRHLAPGGALLFTAGPDAGEAMGTVEGQAVYHASLSPAEYAALIEANGMLARAFVAEDPDCGGHSVWLARAGDDPQAASASGMTPSATRSSRSPK